MTKVLLALATVAVAAAVLGDSARAQAPAQGGPRQSDDSRDRSYQAAQQALDRAMNKLAEERKTLAGPGPSLNFTLEPIGAAVAPQASGAQDELDGLGDMMGVNEATETFRAVVNLLVGE